MHKIATNLLESVMVKEVLKIISIFHEVVTNGRWCTVLLIFLCFSI